ncbi:hypothetical protein BaRGS_00013736 [Batillaria attramentaria]|uniref:Uncharacterized protein n=1 Tax=Batillaria attramentaria TaxID=370345 RepID=A0ABD0L754_9CAEN
MHFGKPSAASQHLSEISGHTGRVPNLIIKGDGVWTANRNTKRPSGNAYLQPASVYNKSSKNVIMTTPQNCRQRTKGCTGEGGGEGRGLEIYRFS